MELGLLEQLQRSKNPRAFISYEQAYKQKKLKVDAELKRLRDKAKFERMADADFELKLARIKNRVNDVHVGISRAKSVLGTIKKVF